MLAIWLSWRYLMGEFLSLSLLRGISISHSMFLLRAKSNFLGPLRLVLGQSLQMALQYSTMPLFAKITYPKTLFTRKCNVHCKKFNSGKFFFRNFLCLKIWMEWKLFSLTTDWRLA